MFDVMLEEHYRKNQRLLAKRYRRALGSDHLAEDVVQEAYARCLKYAHHWDSKQDFAPWFSIILRNAFRDQLNSERGITFEELNEYDFESEDTSRIDDLREALVLEIGKAKEDNQNLLTLFFLDGYTGKEISEITEHSQSKVRQTVHLFKKRFVLRYKE